jgi:hypothetical protein
MKPLFAFLLLSACAISDSNPGTIYEITDHTVTIRGGYSLYSSGPLIPTTAMQEQAKTICPNAVYLNALPYPHDNYTFLYLFKC